MTTKKTQINILYNIGDNTPPISKLLNTQTAEYEGNLCIKDVSREQIDVNIKDIDRKINKYKGKKVPEDVIENIKKEIVCTYKMLNQAGDKDIDYFDLISQLNKLTTSIIN